MRKFEKISKEQYEKDLKGKCEYEDISLPVRSTKHSAGYDFKSPIEFELNPGEIIKVPTGIKAQMEDDEYLMLLVRSSMGFKYNVRLCNQVGIVDSDYYNNPDNEEAQSEFNDAKKDLQIFELMITKKKPTLELADKKNFYEYSNQVNNDKEYLKENVTGNEDIKVLNYSSAPFIKMPVVQ